MSDTVKIAVCLLSLLICFVPGVSRASPEQVEAKVSPTFDPMVFRRLAIYVEDTTRRVPEGQLRSIDDQFLGIALEKGYSLASRSDVEAIKKELAIQESDFTEMALAKQARALNVSAVLLVTVNSFEVEEFTPLISLFSKKSSNKRSYRGVIRMSARMLSAERSQVLWVASHRGTEMVEDRRDYESAFDALPEIAEDIALNLPSVARQLPAVEVATSKKMPQPSTPGRSVSLDAPPIRSQNGDKEVVVAFEIQLDRKLTYYWIDYDGEEQRWGVLDPRSIREQSTFTTHAWRVKLGKKIVGEFVAGGDPGQVFRIRSD